MKGSERALGKRSMLIVLAAALAMAFALSFSMTQTAEAASTSGPYAGYKYEKSKVVNGAGNIQMSTYDARKVKAGYGSFYVWSGNTYLNQDGKQVPAKKAFKKLKGMTYDKKKNTLTLNNVNAPTYRMDLYGMGSGFKIVLKGNNSLASISCDGAYMYNAKGERTGSYPCSLTIAGSGSLVVNKNKNVGTPISMYGNGSASKLVIDKNAKVTLYAYGISNVLSVSSTSVKSASSAIAIKGWTAESPLRVSQTNQPSTNYDHSSVTVLERSFTDRSLCTYNGQLCAIEEQWNETEYTPVYNDQEEIINETQSTVLYYGLRSVSKIATVGKNVYYASGDSYYNRVVASETVASGKGRIVPNYNTDWMTKVKNGKVVYYATESSKGVRYWDPKTRKSLCSKWDVYKKVAEKDGSIYVTFLKTVANNGPLPKGYKGVKSDQYSNPTTYTHVVKNSMLTVSG